MNDKTFLSGKRHWLYILPVLVLLLIPSVGMTVRPTTAPIGNSELAAFPSARNADGTWNLSFLQELGDYYEDHFAFRPELVTADSLLRKQLFGVSSQESVIVGKDGWLYYEATLDDFQHKNNVSDRILFNEAHNVRLMQDYVRAAGADFIFTIAPNKNTLYPEYMPDRCRVQYAEESDFMRLIPFLEAEGVNYVDLYGLFSRERKILYYARDSHWTEEGAVLAYHALLESAGLPHETYEDVQPEETDDFYGDLGAMLYPAGAEPEVQLHYLKYPVYAYVTDTVSVEENYIQTINPAAEGALLMYRDSFGNSLLPYMAQSFYLATFSKQVPYTLTDVQDTQAELVIVERVERHLPTLSSVPALMAAPEWDIVLPETHGEEPELGSIEMTQEGDYYVIRGSVDPSVCAVDGRIAAELTDMDRTVVYEAFCTNTGKTDYAFLLYVPAGEVSGEILACRIFVKNGEQISPAFTYRAEDYEEKMAEAVLRKNAEYGGYPDVSETTAALLYAAEQELSEELSADEPAQKEQTPAEADAADAAGENKEAGEIAEVSRTYVEDCGRDTGYWDVLYSDGHHEYIEEEP